MRIRASENEERLKQVCQLQRRVRAAIGTWDEMPDRAPDHVSLCRLIDAIALAHAAREVDSTKRGPKAAKRA